MILVTQIIFILASLITFVFILAIQFKQKNNIQKRVDLIGTIILYFSFFISWFLGLFTLIKIEYLQPVIILGLIVFVLGAILRTVALKELKGMYNHSVAIKNDHKLIQSGIYSIIRHPLNLGLILEMVGLSLIVTNIITILCLILIILIENRRSKIEDSILRKNFGILAENYQAKVHAFNPFLGFFEKKLNIPYFLS